jgi:multiple sugar transport system ATP-binding protein
VTRFGKLVNDVEPITLISRSRYSVELVLGVRPEDLTVAKGKLGKAEIPAEIYVVEPVGQSTIVDLNVGKYLVKARAPAGFKGEIRENVAVTVAREKIHIFDKKTDQLLV